MSHFTQSSFSFLLDQFEFHMTFNLCPSSTCISSQWKGKFFMSVKALNLFMVKVLILLFILNLIRDAPLQS